MAESSEQNQLPGGSGYLKKVAILWAISLVIAAGTLSALHYYREDIVERLAYGETKGIQLEQYLIDRADELFLEIQGDIQKGDSDFAEDSRVERGIEYYSEALKMRGRVLDESLYEKLGTLYELSGHRERAAEMRARVFILGDKPEGAIDALRNTKDPANLYLLGQAYVEADREADALEVAKRLEAFGQEGSHFSPLLLASVSSYQAHQAGLVGDTATAIEQRKSTVKNLKEAVREDETETEIFVNLADNYRILYSLTNDADYLEQGRLQILNAIELATGDAALYHKLAINLLDQQKPAEAAVALEKAIDIRGTAARLHFDLWRAYRQDGDAFRAGEALKRSMALDPAATNRWLEAK